MKISPLLAALGGGAVGLGLSQGGLGGAGMALSPMLALLLKGKKKGKDGGAQGLPTGPEQGAAVMPPPAPQTPPINPNAQRPLWHGMDRDKLSAALMQFGGQMGSPFGPRY